MTTDRHDDADRDRDLATLRAQFDEADDLLDEAPSPLRSAALMREARRMAEAKRAQPRRWPMALAASVATATFAVFLVNGHQVPETPVTTAALDRPVPTVPASPIAPTAPLPSSSRSEPSADAKSAAAAQAGAMPAAAMARQADRTREPTPFPARRAEAPITARTQSSTGRDESPLAAKPATPALPASTPAASFDAAAAPPPPPLRDAPDPPPARAMAEATTPAANVVAVPTPSPAPPSAPRTAMKTTAADAVAEPPSSAQGEARRVDRLVASTPAPAGASVPTAPSAGAIAPAAALARPWETDPKAWHRHIDDLRRAGRDADADRELERLKARYPDDGKSPGSPPATPAPPP